MYKIIFGIIFVFILFFTLCISFFKPDMHRQFVIFDSTYTIVQPEDAVRIEKTQRTVILETKQNIKPQKKILPAKNTTDKKTNAVTKTIQTVKTSPQKTVEKQEVKKIAEKIITKNQNTIQTAANTEAQEIVLWNKWRSDLQNKLMNDVHLPIVPYGTVFKFKFDVDKYGRVSDIQTWSDTPAFTPYAIQFIAPVIKSYQGRDILNFPAGSNRISTTVIGGWKISDTTKYSSPEDYKDTEKIRK